MQPMAIYSPWHLGSSEPPDLSSPAYRFLAEGDSWFSIGALNPAKNSNLLFEMAFGQSACAVNCAAPGDTLRRMSQISTDRNFVDLLCGRRARIWDGLLLSCGGNDLIDALQARGTQIPLDRRLLLDRTEWGPAGAGAARYLSEAGWNTFQIYFQANLDHFIAMRDRGPSRNCPVFFHGYAAPTPRPAGAGPKLGPWLYPAVTAAGIPQEDLIPVAKILIERLAQLLGDCAANSSRYPNLHFFDTTKIALEPADPHSDGESGDWINEIHLTWRGYEKLAIPWSASIEKILTLR